MPKPDNVARRHVLAGSYQLGRSGLARQNVIYFADAGPSPTYPAEVDKHLCPNQPPERALFSLYPDPGSASLTPSYRV